MSIKAKGKRKMSVKVNDSLNTKGEGEMSGKEEKNAAKESVETGMVTATEDLIKQRLAERGKEIEQIRKERIKAKADKKEAWLVKKDGWAIAKEAKLEAKAAKLEAKAAKSTEPKVKKAKKAKADPIWVEQKNEKGEGEVVDSTTHSVLITCAKCGGDRYIRPYDLIYLCKPCSRSERRHRRIKRMKDRNNNAMAALKELVADGIITKEWLIEKHSVAI